jgi:integrase/recombinase XerD
MTQKFEEYLCIHKGLQPVTVSGYSKAVKFVENKIGELTQEKVENYICNLYQSSFSYSHKVSQARALEYWFEYQGQSIKFGRQRKPKSLIKDTLTEGEITKMFLCCNNIKQRAMLAVLAYSGVRPKEFVRIKRKHINFGTNELFIEDGKGNKDAVIYISSDCVNILIDYLTVFPKQSEDLMFLTCDYQRPFNTGCLRKLIHVLANKAGITKRVYPYILRHSLAVNMINRGCDIFTVKNQLRHAWVQTTLLYLNSLGYGLKNAYEKFRPSYT